MENDGQRFQCKEIHTRFLYPFFIQRKSVGRAAMGLVKLRCPTRSGESPVWDEVDVPHEFYRQEVIGAVRQFLFPDMDDKEQALGGCRYLKVRDDRLSAWFQRGVRVKGPGDERFFAQIAPGAGIEIFLSPYGVGVLSIALMTTSEQCDALGNRLDDIKQFNYRLAQLTRKNTIPDLALPHPSDDPGTMEKAGDHTPPPPATEAPFLERLGKRGGAFTLMELMDFLLDPLKEGFDFKPAQNQFFVYTVVRFDKGLCFKDEVARRAVGPLLAGLAQVEEASHVGAMPGDDLDLPNHVMNQRHWAAVGFLGAAHLLADQDLPRPFDEQKVSVLRDKYFIPYLVALLQRITLHRCIEDASRAVRSTEDKHEEKFRPLHRNLLEFTITGYFTEVSTREALNKFYRISQEGLGVEKALTVVSRTIQNYDADKITEDVKDNVRTVSHVQRKVEWLEVFFVSFYAAELSDIISNHFFAHSHTAFGYSYAAYSVLVWPVFAGLMAAWGLQPWEKHHPETKTKKRLVIILGILLIAVVCWFVSGLVFFRPPAENSNGPSGISSHQMK